MNSDTFIADLHIHSKFSRATAQNLNFENLYIWAQLKGIKVVGTGDFTHPEWFSEINDKLEPAEPGLFRLRSDLERSCNERVPASCRAPVRFMLSCEISNIYKKQNQTRKNHNLVFFPDIKSVRQFNHRLSAIGNIHSDGRPILGLDARDLLEITMETSDFGFLVPAHIWTPWFSMLGSKSGFDSITECFGDLTQYIFAAETGLSSDPPMNWRVADLDLVTLISNSDAHSPAKLGREANLFKTDLNYHSIWTAIKNGDPRQFLGTFEFYPEEGKYHVDGHRKCDICLQPAETRLHQGLCPVCGKKLTLGVLNRVEQLSTRIEGVRPKRIFPFYRLIPLENILSELFCIGPKSKKVAKTYWSLLESLGSELTILHESAIDRISNAGVPLLDEAILRMRENRVTFSPGYDGIFGTVHIFSEAERSKLSTQRSLFSGFGIGTVADRPYMKHNPIQHQPALQKDIIDIVDPVIRLNGDQQKAVDHAHGSLMIVAGPGTGKTRTLTHRIARIIQSGTDIGGIIAVTFTNKAAKEMQERLSAMLGENRPLPFVGTFHSLGYQILRDGNADKALSILDEDGRKAIMRDVLVLNDQASQIKLADLMKWVGLAKQNLLSVHDELDDICPPDQVDLFRRCYESYEDLLKIHHFFDFEDLIFKSAQLLEKNTTIKENYKNRLSDVFIDEYQDINAGQYHLVRLLAGDQANLCVIGDPDQSIYGFRGSDLNCFKWFLSDYPECETVFLQKNYRSTRTILEISSRVIQHNPEPLEIGHRLPAYSNRTGDRTIQLLEIPSENAEAVAIGKIIEKMVGGMGFLSLDSGSVEASDESPQFGFSDFAVLFRTRNQAVPILKILEKAGIPCQMVDRRSVLDHLGLKSLLSIVKLVHGLGGYADLEAASEMMRPGLSSNMIKSLKSWAYKNQLGVEQAFIQAHRLPVPHMGRSKKNQLFEFINQIDELKSRLANCSLADQLGYLSEHVGVAKKFNGDFFFEKGFQQIVESAKGLFSTDTAKFLAAVALCQDVDTYDHRVEKVSLITMHAAKGLEFPVVFISGCEDEWIPYRSENRLSDIQEERRLFYVALTRAKRHLFLSWAKNRRIHGKPCGRHVSPFIENIDMIYKTTFGHDDKKAAQSQHKQLSLF